VSTKEWKKRYKRAQVHNKVMRMHVLDYWIPRGAAMYTGEFFAFIPGDEEIDDDEFNAEITHVLQEKLGLGPEDIYDYWEAFHIPPFIEDLT
jgi:hypothetical protein